MVIDKNHSLSVDMDVDVDVEKCSIMIEVDQTIHVLCAAL